MPRRTPAEASSTGYVPANEGREYVVLSPTDSADAFEVTTVLGTHGSVARVGDGRMDRTPPHRIIGAHRVRGR
jgi:hypothetical protein